MGLKRRAGEWSELAVQVLKRTVSLVWRWLFPESLLTCVPEPRALCEMPLPPVLLLPGFSVYYTQWNSPNLWMHLWNQIPDCWIHHTTFRIMGWAGSQQELESICIALEARDPKLQDAIFLSRRVSWHSSTLFLSLPPLPFNSHILSNNCNQLPRVYHAPGSVV